MRRSLLIAGCIAALTAHAQFGPPRVIMQGAVADPQRVDTIDIDHDGDLDLLVFCQGQDRFMLARNQGSGTFDEPEELLHMPWEIRAVTLRDMNGDGERDLLLGTDEFNGRVSLFLNTGGVFGPEQVVHFANVLSIHAMDVDADGNMDILATDQDWVFWLAGDGSGTFGPRVDLIEFQIYTMELTVADLDQDGLEDIVHLDPGYLGWHRNLGGGAMQDMGEVFVYGTGERPVCGDLDNDGDLDVVVLGNNEIVSFLLDASMTLVLDEEHSGTPFSRSTGAVLADLNGDDLPELVFGGSSANRLVLLPNIGGSFGASSIVESDAIFVNAVTAGDLDGNGTMDVIHGRTFSPVADVRWNSGDGMGNLGPTTPIISSGPPYPWSVATADVDLDGDLDVIGISIYYYYPIPPNTGVYLFENLGDEQFDQGNLLFSGVFDYQGKYLDIRDLNADGYVDIILASDPGASVLMNDGAGGFDLTTTMPSEGVIDITVTDVNGDASPDVVLATETGLVWSANDGLGGFGVPQLVHPTAGPCAFVLHGDVDGDADMDLLAVTADHLQILLFRNNSGGAFDPGVVVLMDTILSSIPMVLVDLDVDGDVDVVYRTGGLIKWLTNDGTGTFGAPIFATGSGPYWTLADVDQDGDVDLISGTIYNPELSYGGGVLYWRPNSGSGQFSASQAFATDQTGNGPMGAADVDGDGDLDVITAVQGHARLAWYENHVGSLYRIDGTVFMDADQNGSFDGADVPFPYAPVSITPMLSTVMSGAAGTYTAFVDTGTFALESVLSAPLWTLTTSPAVRSVQITTLEPQVAGVDFGWAPAIDTSIVLPGFTLGTGPCGSTVQSWLSYRNLGTRIEQGTITLELDPVFSFVSSIPPPSTVVGNSVTWEFDSLGWFGIGQIPMEIQLPPSATDWTSTTTVATVDSLGASTGVFTLPQSGFIGCAYDPNDKQVEPQGYGIHGAVAIDTEWLTYTIRFQNTGTGTAYNVSIIDQLDGDLDRSSLEILGTSHPITSMQIDAAGKAIFRFNNIMLPDSNVSRSASQGYLRYRIRPAEGAADGTQITNAASILFDLNPAIVTNTVTNTLVDCSLFSAEIGWGNVDSLVANAGDNYQWYFEGDSIAGATDQWLLATDEGSYTVEVRSIHGCVDVSDPYDVLITGLMNEEPTRMRILPNPTSGNAHLFCSEVLGAGDRIELVDLHGRTLRSWRGNGTREVIIERGGLSSGVYMIRALRDGSRLATLRLVME